MVTLRLISIGLSGALTEMQLVSGAERTTAASSPGRAISSFVMVFLTSLGWVLGLRGGADLFLDGRLRLVLPLLDPPDLRRDSRNVLQRPRQDIPDDLARVVHRLGGRNQRAEWAANRHVHLQRDLREQAADDLLRARLAEPDALDRKAGREFAGEVAIEADDHRFETQVAQRVERDVAHGAKIGLVDHAVVGERTAGRA